MQDKEAIADLRSLFETADLVKFAKHNPLMNENDANLINAIEFINETKEKEVENAKPQPTEITIIEKRSLRTKNIAGHRHRSIVGCLDWFVRLYWNAVIQLFCMIAKFKGNSILNSKLLNSKYNGFCQY